MHAGTTENPNIYITIQASSEHLLDNHCSGTLWETSAFYKDTGIGSLIEPADPAGSVSILPPFCHQFLETGGRMVAIHSKYSSQ